MAIELTQQEAQKLGFTSVIQTSQSLGFTDFRKSSAYQLRNAYLDLENLGRLKTANPRLVIRKPSYGKASISSNSLAWQSWRQVIESSHWYAKYQITTTLVGQLADIHFDSDFYSYKNNNFFRAFIAKNSTKNIKEYNNFPYARFRFPKYAANTIDIKIQTYNGPNILRPKFPGIISKEEDRKTYLRWYPSATQFISGTEEFNLNNGINYSGFNIPYPNTISIYENVSFNIPTIIAPKFNTQFNQTLNGIIVISTGDAERKTICYVSPHALQTGYANTLEDIYTETTSYVKTPTIGSNVFATVLKSSWHGSLSQGYLGCFESGYLDNLNGLYRQAPIPSPNNTHKRFYKVGEPRKQIYFDHKLPTPYGSGRWCVSISGDSNINSNRNISGLLYVHQPSSLTDWKKQDPRSLTGPWIVASGYSGAAHSEFLNRSALSSPRISQRMICRKVKNKKTERLQLPSLFIDSKYKNDGKVLPEGIKSVSYSYVDSIYPKWKTSAVITGAPSLEDPSVITTGWAYNPEGLQHFGYIIDGVAVSMEDILNSGITIPQIAYSGLKYTVDNNGYFKQNAPLRDTYFYKFYNSLYRNNKTIATGTWDGVVPSGVKVSVELISTTLNTNIGISSNAENIAIVYSGYGNEDFIDKTLQTGISRAGAHILYPNPSEKYMISGEITWHQKRSPYRHAFNEQGRLAYTAFKSGPTESDAIAISKITAISKINSKILQLVNKLFPNFTYKNKKWKRLQAFKGKIEQLKSTEFNRLVIPSTSEPGSQTRNRLRPYSP